MISFDLYKTNIGFTNTRNLSHIVIGPDGKAKLSSSLEPKRRRVFATRNDVMFCRNQGVIMDNDDGKFYSKNLAALKPHVYGRQQHTNQLTLEKEIRIVEAGEHFRENMFGQNRDANRSLQNNCSVIVSKVNTNSVERTLNRMLRPGLINLTTELNEEDEINDKIEDDQDSIFKNEETLDEYISKHENLNHNNFK